MNVVTRTAAQAHSLDGIGSVMTLVFFAVFVGWIVWAWWPGNRAHLDAMARIPLDDDFGGDR